MKYILLDFDGTIGDTQRLIVQTLQDTMRSRGLEVKSDDECASTIGLRLDAAFARMYGMDAAEATLCADTYRDIFLRNKEVMKVEPFPHTLETIRTLHDRGCLVAIVSSRSRVSLLDYLHQLNLTDCVSAVVAADDVEHTKPEPDMVYKALKTLGGADADLSAMLPDTLVVGDMVYDVDMAHRAGALSCAVTYGNGTLEELSHANWVIDDFSQILSLK